MPSDAEEGIGIEILQLALSLAPCGGAGCCPRPPLPWRRGRPGTIAGPSAAVGSGEMPGDAEEGIGIEMLPLVLSLAPCGGTGCCPRPPLPWRYFFGLQFPAACATRAGGDLGPNFENCDFFPGHWMRRPRPFVASKPRRRF